MAYMGGICSKGYGTAINRVTTVIISPYDQNISDYMLR